MGINHLDVGEETPFNPSIDEIHKSIAVGAALFTPWIPPNARNIMVQAVAKDIRYTLEGTTPTGAFGFVLIAGDPPTIIPITEHTKLAFFGSDAAAVLQYCIGE